VEFKTREQERRPERVVLVGVLLERGSGDNDPLAELAALAESAGATPVARVTQHRQKIHAATYVGKGKVDEIRQKAEITEADTIIFDNDLSPSQIREIEEVVQRKVIDRSELILDIFARRARTNEARLQVELAQLEYTAPRLRGMWTHLERIAGAGGGTGVGSVGGIGTRGPGERQIEIDRRLVGRRVALLKDRIAQIDRRKVREVAARHAHYTVSIVGYTNAGKSTLMNALTHAGVVAADRLFATLDTLTRKWVLGGGREVLLSDTVGFIRNLPHHLVASFRATLEEAIHANLLLHVVDTASPEAESQIAAVEGVLEELGVSDKPTLLVLNKADAVQDHAAVTILRKAHPDAVLVSSKTGDGLDALRDAVLTRLRSAQRAVQLAVPLTAGKALNFLETCADVSERRYEDGCAILDVRITPEALEHVYKLGHGIRALG
jgi:GTP-binding protein HflX